MSWTTEAAVGLVVVMGVCMMQSSSCRCSNDGPRAPDASVEPPDAAPTASEGPQSDSGPPDSGLGWEPVVDLQKAEGSWGGGDDEPLVIITSREASKAVGTRWPYPYPWHLHAHDPETKQVEPYDCGFHVQVEGGDAGEGWRVAYCQGGHFGLERRHATTLWLHIKELPTVELVKARIGSDAEVVARRH